MTSSGEQFSILDAIAIVSFLIGLANYEENVDQSQLQETINKAVEDIHNHLQSQDAKLAEIIDLLKGEQHEDHKTDN